MVPKKYWDQYQEWLSQGPHYCACGCGLEVVVDYKKFTYHIQRKLPLKFYLANHHLLKAKKASVTTFGNCVIAIVPKEIRCKDYVDCEYRLECLEFVTAQNKGLGWKKLGEVKEVNI